MDPLPAGAGWRERLVQVLSSYTALLFEHPALARYALAARPFGRHYLDLIEALLAPLADGGVPADRTAWGVDLLLQLATATAAEQSTRHAAPGAREEMAALAAAVRDVSPLTHPHLAALADDLLSGPGQARLAWGFHVLINGIVRTSRPAGPESR